MHKLFSHKILRMMKFSSIFYQNLFPIVSLLRSPSQKRTVSIPRTYVLRCKTVRFWDGNRKRMPAKTTRTFILALCDVEFVTQRKAERAAGFLVKHCCTLTVILDSPCLAGIEQIRTLQLQTEPFIQERFHPYSII